MKRVLDTVPDRYRELVRLWMWVDRAQWFVLGALVAMIGEALRR